MSLKFENIPEYHSKYYTCGPQNHDCACGASVIVHVRPARSDENTDNFFCLFPKLLK